MRRDRRQFIRGQWIPQAAKTATPHGAVEIASILVQTRPQCLASAEQSILAVKGAEIYARDPRGKLVVVIEAEDDSGAIGAALTEISTLPDVITATLVYHHGDVGTLEAQKATS
jgi:periplasmic nitrate reductase NapD